MSDFARDKYASRWAFDAMYGVRPVRPEMFVLKVDDLIHARRQAQHYTDWTARCLGVAAAYQRARAFGGMKYWLRRFRFITRKKRTK